MRLQPGFQPVLVRRPRATGGRARPRAGRSRCRHGRTCRRSRSRSVPPSRQPQPRRALHVDEEGVDRALRARRAPARCPASAPVLDRRAVEIGRDARSGRGARSASRDPSPAGRSPRIDFDQIGRAAVERNGEAAGRRAARLDLRLVIAGDEARRRRSRCGTKLRSKKSSRAVALASPEIRSAARAARAAAPSPSMPSARVFGGAAAISRAPARNAAKRRAHGRRRASRRYRRKQIGSRPACRLRASDEALARRPCGAPDARRIRRPRWRPASSSDRASSTSRAKVQTSRIVCTSVASPSTTLPSLSRVQLISSATKRTRDARRAAVELGRRSSWPPRCRRRSARPSAPCASRSAIAATKPS